MNQEKNLCKPSHVVDQLREIQKTRTSSLKKADFSFDVYIDDDVFVAHTAEMIEFFGVVAVVGIIEEHDVRRYVTFAYDSDLPLGKYPVEQVGEVTIGYVIEKTGSPTVEMAAVSGVAAIYAKGDTHRGAFDVTLEPGFACSTMSLGAFSVAGTALKAAC